MDWIKWLYGLPVPELFILLGLAAALLSFGFSVGPIKSPSKRGSLLWIRIGAILLVSIGLFTSYYGRSEALIKASGDYGAIYRSTPLFRTSDKDKPVDSWLRWLSQRDLDKFKRGFLSYELSEDIGKELKADSSLDANMSDLFALLDASVNQSDPVPAINLVELSGNLWLHWLQPFDSLRPLLQERIQKVKSTFQLDPDLQELTTLKLSILSADTTMVLKLIEELEHRGHTWYRYGIFENSELPLHLVFKKELGPAGQLYAAYVLGYIVEPTDENTKFVRDKLIVQAKKEGRAKLALLLGKSLDRLEERKKGAAFTKWRGGAIPLLGLAVMVVLVASLVRKRRASTATQVDVAHFIDGTWQVDINYELLYGLKVEAIGLGEALMYYNPRTRTATSMGYTEVKNGFLVNPVTGEKEAFALMMSWEVPDVSFGQEFEEIHFSTRVYSACTDNQAMKESIVGTVDIRTGGTLKKVKQGTALKFSGKMSQVDTHGLVAVVSITKLTK